MYLMVVSDKGHGRIMGLDLGDKRIGIAVSDPTRMIARSFGVLKRTSREEDFAALERIVSEQEVDLLVVGLPTLPSGEEGTRAAWSRDYGSALARQIGIELVFWDESFSTRDAAASLLERGSGKKKRRDDIDAIAAAFILQSYLDANRLKEPD